MHRAKQVVGAIAMCVAPFFLSLIMGAGAPKTVVGIIVDFAPRGKVEGSFPFTIERDGRSLAVRESEIIYEGDTIAFDSKADRKSTFIDVLVSGDNVIKLDPEHQELPNQNWPMLQALWPRLVAAYRWVASSSEDNVKFENAVSRGGDDPLTVLPHVRRPLIISRDSAAPLWLGWSGGKPPFTLTATSNGKQVARVIVCPADSGKECNREAIFSLAGAPDELELSLESSDGAIWKKQVIKQPVTWKGELADVTQLGKLGPFLRATDLLDRGHGEYVLESARELNSATTTYAPARTLLKQIREGQVP
ncbi:hypothetical protein [Hyphomicrobium sp.]|uniref:hypothetical protein n=1 Tax=Hyphomicrobium sp. TaxID=82 RepID=UPI000F99106E|nr:hypothetical protein [Hyphomicrobium sp.]RUO99076.1 MAG: hypothetical protein EKK30_07435 [Hyphomicrobium sp.]